MRTNYCLSLIVLLYIALLVSACSISAAHSPNQNKTQIAVSSEHVTTERVSTAIETTTPGLPSPELIITTQAPSLVSPPILETPYTYAIIEAGQGMGDFCMYESNKFINISVYPYHKAQKVLSEPGIDYWGSHLSPDHQWIAIIKSSPNIIPDNLSFDAIPTDMQLPGNGTASIWLMHPDGSDLHQVSEDVPSNYQAFITGNGYVGCEISSGVKAIDWLPDSQSLVFVSMTMGKFSYYWVDLKSRSSRLLLTSDHDWDFWWFPGKREFWWDTEEDNFRIFDLTSQNGQAQYIPYALPEGKTRQEYGVGWHTTPDADVLFALIWGNETPTMNYRATWQYNLKTQQWKKLAEYNPYSPLFSIFQNRLYTFDPKTQTIEFFDTLLWQKTGVIKISAQLTVEHIIDVYVDDNGNEWVILECAVTEGEQKSIWGLPTWIENAQPVLILDLSALKINEFNDCTLIP